MINIGHGSIYIHLVTTPNTGARQLTMDTNGYESDNIDDEIYPAQTMVFDNEYEMFDETALGVMQSNHDLLESEREQIDEALKHAQSVSFRFDVATGSKRERDGSNCVVDFKTMVEDALHQRCGDKTLPSTTCYIDEIVVEDSINTLPVDVHIGCKQDSKNMGSFVKGKIENDEANHISEPALWIAHSGSEMHSDSGRKVFEASQFVQGDNFRTYLQALKKDVEDTVSLVKGSDAVEYLSPWAVVSDDEVVTGDWFVDVMYKNAKSFGNRVQAIQTPVESSDDYVISLRMHKNDWKQLHKSVNSKIVGPLRRSVVDLENQPEMYFTLSPSIPQNGLQQGTPSGAQAWKHPHVNGHQGRVACTLRATVKFV